ncbi:Hsp33 family molecular chaperone HslO [Pseudidiomarina insulisalsae]|uniref:Hsp33 family molecular chaperone HslO n=1 Tax=Pseudidiomarina insulisalsae TaxID=575789 RepID=A0A432YNQ3_9GAMM|nr:Hsp33 family molecular chaperone HslO [Pseudidiomarina insulisalsae]RUO62580.1 Hsp33 family molecular chaperone HslO [Pseudidiomarina insulisalsae]
MNYPVDQLFRYTFSEQDVRGELVQLSSSYQRMIHGHDYPAPVQRLLGELMATTALLSATLKFEGQISLQLQGDGPINFITVNGSHEQDLRGLARVREAIADDNNDFRALFGKAVLIITITPDDGERYQGVVDANADSLAQVIERYFAQSEQLHTRLWLHADGEHAAGMFLQVMPAAGHDRSGFEHLETLTASMTAHELYTLPGEEVLHRLYHQEQVELYRPQPVTFHCGCSRERTLESLSAVHPDELRQILAEDGEIVMTCDYCLSEYRFTEQDL